MSPLYLVRFEPLEKTVVVSPGVTLWEAAQRAGISLGSVCNGQGWCGECAVVVLEGQVSAATEEEMENMSQADRDAQRRLACHVRVYSNARVLVPPGSLKPPAEVGDGAECF